MKNHSKILLIALVIVLIAPACKKYPDGPTISFRSKKARLVNKWKIEKEYEDGIDNTTTYQAAFPNLIVDIRDDGTVVSTYTGPGNSIVTMNATWAFNSDKAAVNITTGGVSVGWTILMLKNDEIWLKATLGITITEIHYITS